MAGVTVNYCAALHQQMCQMMMAQSAKMDQFWGMMLELQADVRELKKSVLMSSSGSSGRVVCPLQCGADFKKVIYIY